MTIAQDTQPLTGTVPPPDDGTPFNPYDLIDRLTNGLIFIALLLFGFATFFGLKAADSIPRRALPFVNLGQRAAEWLTPGDKSDDAKIRRLAEGLGYDAVVNADGSITWRIKPTPSQITDWTEANAIEFLRARRYQVFDPPPERGDMDDATPRG